MSRNKPAAAAVVEEEVEIVGPFKTKKEIKKFFTSLDRRKTKRVCEDDFVEGLLSQLNYLNVEKAQLEAFWRTFTQDKNGEVDLKGFQHRLLPVKEPTEEGKESKRTATKVKDKETSSSSSRGGAKKAEQKQSESKKVDLNLPKTHAAYSKLQDLNKAESKKKKKQHVYSAEEMRGVFFELLQLEAPTRTDAKVLFKKLVAFASVNVANTDFSEYHFWPAPEVKNDSDGQVQGDNNGNSTGQEPGGKELALDGFGFSVGPVETAAETAATSVAARPTAPTRKEKVGTVSKKTFLKVCTRIIVEYRQICVVEDTHIDVWASGREGYRASDVEKLWRALAMDDTTRLDQDTFVHWLIVKEDSAAGDQGATGKGGKKGKKGAAAAAAASPKKKAKKKKGKNRGNPNAKHKEKKRKHASPEYKLLTVKEPKLQDFAGEILLNHLRVNEGKEIFSEPPLTHWDEATEKLKGVQDSGYGQLLFLINKTRVRAVIWTDADSGPVLFVSFVTMLSSRSTSRWLYHAKLFFDRSEKLSHIETRSIRTFIDGYLYDSENIEDFENWTKYVRGEGEHDYHLLRDVPT